MSPIRTTLKIHERFFTIIVKTDRPGYEGVPYHGKLSLRTSESGDATFKNMRVPVSNLPGEEGNGFYNIMNFFNRFRVQVAENKFNATSERLLGSIFFTTTSLLDEGVTNIPDMDVGAKMGLRWRQGPFEIMNAVGIEKSRDMVEHLLEPYPKVSVPPVLMAQKEKGVPWSVD